VSIRAPGQEEEEGEAPANGNGHGNGMYASIATPPPQSEQGQQMQGYYQNGYNPYAEGGYGQVQGQGQWNGSAGYEGVQVGYGYEDYSGY
jgi:hypothetical protein